MFQDNLLRELIIDNFAGGGGASTGMELALGVPVDIAINHDEDAIAMHRVNHPHTTHYQEDGRSSCRRGVVFARLQAFLSRKRRKARRKENTRAVVGRFEMGDEQICAASNFYGECSRNSNVVSAHRNKRRNAS